MPAPSRVDPGRVRSVLLIRPRFIGDICLTLPVVEAVRAACPEARIGYLLEHECAPLLDGDPRIDTVIVSPRKPSAGEWLQVVSRVRRFAPDLVLDLFCNPRTAQWTLLSGARERVGYAGKGVRSAVYTHRIRARALSAIEHHLESVAALGWPAPVTTPRLHVGPAARDQVTETLARLCVPAATRLRHVLPLPRVRGSPRLLRARRVQPLPTRRVRRPALPPPSDRRWGMAPAVGYARTVMKPPLVTFVSDFGRDDWFVGVVHGVILEACPEARIVDLTHHIPPGDVDRAAFGAEVATPDFAAGPLHLVLADPGVRTGRRALAVRAPDQIFVVPVNGVLEWALAAPGAEVRELTDVKLFRQPVSRTFHGRDVFAPVAARLACGLKFESVGPVAKDPLRLPVPTPQLVNGELRGRIMFVDRFGNLLTNLTERLLAERFPDLAPERLEVEAAGCVIRGLARAYADAPVGSMGAILDSTGRLEIAQVRGDASQRLGLSVRDDVRVRVRR